ncbi:MAG TPA: tRNA uridine-5-carboxymethylaminomethyl(34) synthesis GTPase MnmE [Roseimicrobium sp.]|nr:tRNA uridine-5-carboxymethylaminomethyl(34) synthesis GTPase MnmE [Roseimicrobium sp.]
MLDDTIAAIATPLGEGGLAVIRISGSSALSVADRVFQPAGKAGIRPSLAASHTVHYGHIVRGDDRIDEILLTVMRAPRTFTREDVVEISCHGGLLPARAVLSVILENGARLAQPGEFTRRAFLNGRIDLAQAEAVADVIHARTDLALRAANEQLSGKLSLRIGSLRDDLMLTLAHVEAHIDFPDEDIAPDTLDQLLGRIARAIGFLDELLRTAPEGRLLRRGIRAAIVGRPNAGKSSLLNQLLGMDRAIVSPIAGTTRDTIEETANVRGVPVVFIDTAGLREAGDSIEAEGIRRSHASLESAELVLHVLDAAEPLAEEDLEYLRRFSQKRRILVRNKVDLPVRLELPADGPTTAVVDVSCASGQGIELLKDAIQQMVWSGKIHAEMLEVMINARHQEALQRGRQALDGARSSLTGGMTLELAAMELRVAVNAVGEVVGKTTTEDLLDRIFSEFCLGK